MSTGVKIGFMDEKKKDRHKHGGFSLRLPKQILKQLDALAKKNASKRTEEVRRAIRKHLQEEGLWPPSPD